MPIDRGAIDAQLREIGEGDRWWELREFRDLPYILHDDERIRGITRGKLLGPPWPRLKPAGRWLIVATNRRLLCLRQERFARRQVEIAAGQIAHTRTSRRLSTYQIVIQGPSCNYRLRIGKVDAFRFATALEPLIAAPLVQRLDPDEDSLPRFPGAGALAALPGMGGMVARAARGPQPDYATREQLERVELTVERMQREVERLQQQVAFLEDLLQKRAEDSFSQS